MVLASERNTSKGFMKVALGLMMTASWMRMYFAFEDPDFTWLNVRLQRHQRQQLIQAVFYQWAMCDSSLLVRLALIFPNPSESSAFFCVILEDSG